MIELRDIDKTYAASKGFLYVKELVIPRGEIVGILGANGSGKTTLLKIIMGLGELQGGEVQVEGLPPQQRYERMAFITEEGSFPSDRTAVQYGEFLGDFFPRFDRKLYFKLLDYYGLELGKRIQTFSKGQKLQLEISAGIAKKADYILLDEPFVGKDVFTRKNFLKLLVAGLHGHETVLMATHIIDEIEHVIDRAIILNKGLVKADRYMDDLREQGRSLEELLAEAGEYKEMNYREVYE